MTRLLILGGTTEGRALAEQVVRMGLDATLSLAGVTSKPKLVALESRVGGFGGVEGLTDWLRQNETQALIDATHAFARRMPWNAFDASVLASLPRLRLLRPAFARDSNRSYSDSLETALASLRPGHRVLLTTGHMDASALWSRPDLSVLVRSIEPIAGLPPNTDSLIFTPPLDLESELEVLRTHQIETLIAKDSGGPTQPKLDAARIHGAKVILINRPQQPPGPTVETVDQAVAWLKHVVAIAR
ncbi:MAG: precorrin-6A/cobalt-precorrin-6A reductase [Paracoccaceae bacterium]